MEVHAHAAGVARNEGIDMFGKTRDINDTDTLDSSALDGFFGDEAAAENHLELSGLRDRVEQVEAQISSQFTSLATYAQIAQEQVEMARSESKAATERSEQRVTSLIERERADRITAYTGEAPDGSPDVSARLDALEHSVARIQKGLDDCRHQQKELALAITAMFDRLTPGPAESSAGEAGLAEPHSIPGEPALLAPPVFASMIDHEPAGDFRVDSGDQPIRGLALNG